MQPVHFIRISIYISLTLCIFCLIQSATSPSFTYTNYMEEREWWIQVEIFPKKGDQQELNNEILLILYDDFLSHRRQNISSWHFFREPQLRFRIEVLDRETRDNTANDIDNFLSTVDLVATYYFANHEVKVENLDEGYSGEQETYKRMWTYQKKIWEWGSEMTVEALKEFRETGTNDPTREYQLERVFHLLALQLSPEFEQRRQIEGVVYPLATFIFVPYSIILSAWYTIKIRRDRKEK